MQKKLLAVAVAGAMFVPAAAMAQSSVTISGIFKVSIDQIRLSDRQPTGLGGGTGHSSQFRVTDNSSRMIFGITEDLGGGLSGIAQLDARFQPDDAGGGFAESGNTWVGLRSTSLGTLTFGRHDLHYGKQPDETAALAGMLQASAVSLMDYTGAGVSTAVAYATRTPNVVRYDTPRWGGFAATVAWASEGDADIGSAVRRGSAWNFNPSYTSGPFQIGYSYWRQKPDAVDAEQKSHAFYGYYRFGAFKVGAAINDAENELVGTTVNDRRSWTIPVVWAMGPHHLAGHYTRAGDDDAVAGDDGARMVAVAYSYLLSKRTSVGVTWASLRNDAGAAYNFFTNTGGLAAGATPVAGEDLRLLGFTMRHAF